MTDGRLTINTESKCAGHYRILVHDSVGQVKHDTGWFANLITNQGLDWLGTAPPLDNTVGTYICTHVGVGTGNTAPLITDTALTSFLAMYPAVSYTNIGGAYKSSYVAGPPAYWSRTFAYGFAVGAVVGNISEVGTGNTAAGNTQPQLFSHALIVDNVGNPTTLSILVTDTLTIYFELRMYLDLTDNTYSVNISGVTYTGTYRRASVGTIPVYEEPIGYNLNGVSFAATVYYYNGTIDTYFNTPTGTSTGGPNQVSTTAGTYTTSSHFRSLSSVVGTAYANFVSPYITAFMLTSEHGSYQFSVTPGIPKTSSNVLTLTWNVSWSRYP